MFKLVLLSALVALAAAKPSNVLGQLVSEKTIESHGNSVVHATAPLAAEAVLPVAPLVPTKPAVKAATLISEKTIESHGHSIVHDSAPALSYVATAPIVPAVSVKTALFEEKPSEAAQDKASIVQAAALAYAASPIYSPYSIYYSYPAALIGEKTISSYGHSVVHGA